MIRRPPRSTLDRSSAASDVYKRQVEVLELRSQVVFDDLFFLDAAVAAAEGFLVLDAAVEKVVEALVELDGGLDGGVGDRAVAGEHALALGGVVEGAELIAEAV